MFKKIYILFLFSSAFNQECPPLDTLTVNVNQNNWGIPYINSWDELEVVTWNVKTFPQSNYTIESVVEIISDLLPDIINFQEINSYSDFQDLANSLEAYDFIYSNDDYYGLAIAYRKDCIEFVDSSILFEQYPWEFTYRYPLSANFIWSCGDSYLVFEMVNVHLKCCDSGFEQRAAASEILSNYINEKTGNNINLIIAGDYNDSLTDSPSNNSLLPLIDNPNVLFLDFDIAEGSSYYWSYPSWPSHIDHILVNTTFENYSISEINSIRIDDYVGYNFFQNNISDHRPVYAKIFIPSSTSPENLIINEIMNNPLAISDSYGEWFEIFNNGLNEIDLYNFIIRDNGNDYHFINDHIIIQPGEYSVFGISNDLNDNGQINVDYQYSDFYLNNFIDEIILQHPNGSIIDQVNYYINSFEIIEGKSMMLINSESDNNVGSNWNASNIIMSNGDYGTPGNFNILNDCNNNGDINNDLEVNIVDVILLVNYILYNNSEYSNIDCISDLDSNNIIDILDVILLIEYILGIN